MYDTVKSTLVYSGPAFDLYSDVVKMPDGKNAVRDHLKRGKASAIVPIDENGNIILVKQYRHPAGKEVFEIPAGMLENGEEPLDCAKRELEEETGFFSENLTYLFSMYPAVGICNEELFMYKAENLKKGSMHLDPDEFIEPFSVSFEKALEMIFDGSIKDSKTITGVLACKKTAE